MALVKCPSCGNERVSDSASSCPNCGFNVKEYYSRLKSTELKNNTVSVDFENRNIADNSSKLNSYSEPRINNYQNGSIAISKNKNIAGAVIVLTITALVILLIWVMFFVLTKPKEMDKVESDIQLCKSVKTALEVANSDAEIAGEGKTFRKGDKGELININYYAGPIYTSCAKETLGVEYFSEVNDQIESTLGKKTGEISFVWVSDSSVVVYIDNTDNQGGTKMGFPLTNKDCRCIYAGPVELVPDNINKENENVKKENTKQGSKHKVQTNNNSTSEKAKDTVTKPSTPVINTSFEWTQDDFGNDYGALVSWSKVPEADGYQYSYCAWNWDDEVEHAGESNGYKEYTTDTEIELVLGSECGGFSVAVRSYKLDGNKKVYSDWSNDMYYSESYEDETESNINSEVSLEEVDQAGAFQLLDGSDNWVCIIYDEGEYYYTYFSDGCGRNGGLIKQIEPGYFLTDYDKEFSYPAYAWKEYGLIYIDIGGNVYVQQ